MDPNRGAGAAMNPIVLSVIDVRGEVIHRLVIDDTGCGVEIRPEKDCLIAADRSVVIDLDHPHCSGCPEIADDPIYIRLGLNDDEADILRRWRTRKEDGHSAALLGEILDKVVKAINTPDPECRTIHERFLLRVESANG